MILSGMFAAGHTCVRNILNQKRNYSFDSVLRNLTFSLKNNQFTFKWHIIFLILKHALTHWQGYLQYRSIYELPHENHQNDCALSEDTDQPRHPGAQTDQSLRCALSGYLSG